jgi:hypothetical protein
VLVGRFAFPPGQQRSSAEHGLFLRQVVENIRTIPGVVAVSPAVGYPLQGGPQSAIRIPGTSADGDWRAALEFVGDGYFRAVGLPLVTGRLLSPADVEGARPVMVVNQRFVQDFLGGTNPLGRTVLWAATAIHGRSRPSCCCLPLSAWRRVWYRRAGRPGSIL